MRIISLVPAATEILYALGLGEQLVGRSHECDFPEAVKDVPVCTSTRILAESSYLIDQEVKSLQSRQDALYELDADLIAGLNPGLIITQDQCSVCALDTDFVRAQLSGRISPECRFFSLGSDLLSGVLEDILEIGRITGAQSTAVSLVEDLNERAEVIRHKLKFFSTRPRVACIEWLDPLMIAGNWTPGLIEIAGGEAVLAKPGEHSGYINFETLAAADPEVLVFMPCGFTIGKSLSEVPELLSDPKWAALSAVREGNVFIADGNAYFNRPGPRILDSLEILAEILYPKQFVFGYEGEGWLRYQA